jgi:hypothetical protein
VDRCHEAIFLDLLFMINGSLFALHALLFKIRYHDMLVVVHR